jgi:hypothetical protein
MEEPYEMGQKMNLENWNGRRLKPCKWRLLWICDDTISSW